MYFFYEILKKATGLMRKKLTLDQLREIETEFSIKRVIDCSNC